MLEKAMRLCEAAFGILRTYDGDQYHAVATHGVPPAYAEFLTNTPQQPQPGTIGARIVQGEPLVHIVDAIDDELYPSGDLHRRALVDLGGARTTLVVPLRKDQTLLGAIQIYRQEVRPFTDKQIALFQNFAAQAVIAMENARLITETREALEQQTATAEVLQVINSSPGDLAPVFDAMLEKAMRLCEARSASLWTYDGEYAAPVALTACPEICRVLRQRDPHRPATTVQQRPAQRRALCPDRRSHERRRPTDPAIIRRARGRLGGVAHLLGVALRKDDRLLGASRSIARRSGRSPTSRSRCLQNFAAQAVIAMENARLITETREALEQQTATAEVLQVINSSPGDLAPVFEAMLEKAHGLCEARSALCGL